MNIARHGQDHRIFLSSIKGTFCEDAPLLGPLATPSSWGEDERARSKELVFIRVHSWFPKALPPAPHLPAYRLPRCRNSPSRPQWQSRFPARATVPVSRRLPAARPDVSPTATKPLADSRKRPNASKKETPPTVRQPNDWRHHADTESCAGKNIERTRQR